MSAPITRRTALAAAAAMPIATVLPAMASQAADPIVAMWAERKRLLVIFLNGPEDDGHDARFWAWTECGNQIANTPASNMEGISIKLEMFLEWIDGGDSEGDKRLAESLTADIRRLGGLS